MHLSCIRIFISGFYTPAKTQTWPKLSLCPPLIFVVLNLNADSFLFQRCKVSLLSFTWCLHLENFYLTNVVCRKGSLKSNTRDTKILKCIKKAIVAINLSLFCLLHYCGICFAFWLYIINNSILISSSTLGPYQLTNLIYIST